MKRIGMLLLFVVGVFPASAQEAQNRVDSARVWYSIGKDYLLKKRYDDAIRDFVKALEYNDTFALAYLDLAQAYLGKATQIYERNHDDSWKAFVDSARVVYETMRKKLPGDSRALQGLGYLYGVVLKDVDRGLSYYREALKLDPENTDVAFGLAKLLETAGRVDEAEQFFKNILAKDSTNDAYAGAYGLFLSRQKRYDEAIPLLERGIRKYPTNKDLLGAYVQSALAINKKSLKNRDILEKALGYLNQLIEMDPGDVQQYIRRADILDRLGQKERALKDLDKAMELNPNYATPYLKKAGILLDLNRGQEAEQLLQKALGLDQVKQYPPYQAAAYSLLGYIYYQRGYRQYKGKDYKAAMNFFKQAKQYYTSCGAISGTPYTATCQEMQKKSEKMEKKAYRKDVGIE